MLDTLVQVLFGMSVSGFDWGPGGFEWFVGIFGFWVCVCVWWRWKEKGELVISLFCFAGSVGEVLGHGVVSFNWIRHRMVRGFAGFLMSGLYESRDNLVYMFVVVVERSGIGIGASACSSKETSVIICGMYA